MAQFEERKAPKATGLTSSKKGKSKTVAANVIRKGGSFGRAARAAHASSKSGSSGGGKSRTARPEIAQGLRRAPDLSGTIYLSGNDAAAAIKILIAMNGLLDQIGYLPLVPLNVERGSWLADITAKAKAGLRSKDAKVLAEQARITAEAYAEKQKVENLEAMARATAALMSAVPEGDTALFDLPGLRMVSQEVDGKRHWVVQGETARTQAIRTVDQAKAMSQQVFDEYYPETRFVDAADKPTGEIEP